MIDQHRIEPYSIPGRICLGIATFGGALLVTVVLIFFFMQ
jgi:hypothetical protein